MLLQISFKKNENGFSSIFRLARIVETHLELINYHKHYFTSFVIIY